MSVLVEDCMFVLVEVHMMAFVAYTVEQALGVVHRLVWACKLALEPLLAYKQAWLVVVVGKLEPVAHKPVLKLEVVGRYELEDVQHRLYVELVLELVVVCTQAFLVCKWVLVCRLV